MTDDQAQPAPPTERAIRHEDGHPHESHRWEHRPEQSPAWPWVCAYCDLNIEDDSALNPCLSAPTEREEREPTAWGAAALEMWEEAVEAYQRQHVGDQYGLIAAGEALADALRTHSPEEPCRIYEYDGAFRCHTHDRLWGAVADPDEPCVGLEPEPPGNHWRTHSPSEDLEAIRHKLQRPLRTHDDGHRCDYRTACEAAIQSIDTRMERTLSPEEPVDVVAAVRRDDDGMVWLCKRNSDGDHAGLAGMWEYPGGKVEDGEQLRDALVREILEEFPGCVVNVGRVLDSITSVCEGTAYRVTFFEVAMSQVTAHPTHEKVGWFTPDEACALDHLPSGVAFNARHLASPEEPVGSQDCDCENPDGEGVAHVSESCPVHNLYPEPPIGQPLDSEEGER